MAEKKDVKLKTHKLENGKNKVTKKTTIKTSKKEEAKSGANKENHKTADQTNTEKQELVTAKAGKRSTKALKETEEKQQKEARKAEVTSDKPAAKPKTSVKLARSRLQRRSKNYRKSAELIDRNKEYSIKDAVALVGKTSTTKFDAAVELHVNLNLDPRHADQNVRGNITMPAGTGKNVKIAVFAEVDDAKAAKQAGADQAGIEEITAKLDKELIDFDILIAVPQQMAQLAKYARLLGPKGLMPNPKSGTVAKDVVKAVKEAKAGRIEYRVDATGIVHLRIGKVSFGADKLLQNVSATLDSIKRAKPSSVKGNYVTSVYLTTAMGPSVRINASEIS